MIVEAMHVRLAPSGTEIGSPGNPGALMSWDDTTKMWTVSGAPADNEVPIWDAATSTWVFVALPSGLESGFDYIIHDLADLAAVAPFSGGMYQAPEGGYSFKGDVLLDAPIYWGFNINATLIGMGEALIQGPDDDAAMVFDGPSIRASCLRVRTGSGLTATGLTTPAAGVELSFIQCDNCAIQTQEGTGVQSTVTPTTYWQISNCLFVGESDTALAFQAEEGTWQIDNCRIFGGRWWDFGAEISDIAVQITNLRSDSANADVTANGPMAIGDNGRLQVTNWSAYYLASTDGNQLVLLNGGDVDRQPYLFQDVFLRVEPTLPGDVPDAAIHVYGSMGMRDVGANGVQYAVVASPPGAYDHQAFDHIFSDQGAILGVTTVTARVNLRQCFSGSLALAETPIV